MLACRLFGSCFLLARLAACWVYFCADATAASWAVLSKLVTIFSPPPAIWAWLSPLAASSCSTIFSRKPFGPAYRWLSGMSGNAGNCWPYSAACAWEIFPSSAIPCRV